MKLLICFLSLFLIVNNLQSQTKDEILAEAYLLYHSEMASWNGTDIFLDRFPHKTKLIGGYFSFTEDDTHSCIFFDQSDDPYVLAKISFNNNFNLENVLIDSTYRKLNDKEFDLFDIRNKAINEIGKDTLFKHYENTRLNPIPIITKKEKKVFILTGPQLNGVVIFGNDYLLTFNKRNQLKKKRALHKNIIPIEFTPESKDDITMHSHSDSTGDLITSTDICSILLYDKYANWKEHLVISKNKVSIWNCNK